MTRSRDNLQVLFAAFDLAHQAKVLNLQAVDVANLQASAEQVLDHDDPAFYAINRFATDYQLARLDPAIEFPRIGQQLIDAITLATQPEPPDAGRKDIYG